VSWFVDRSPGRADKGGREVAAMRFRLLTLGILPCVGLGLGSFLWTCEHLATKALAEEARLAVEDGRAGRKNRTMLTKPYAPGALDPDRTLRACCEGGRTARWQASRTLPPEVCVQRYGGS